MAVHPRVCGERWEQGAHAEVDSGSSPRVRGTAERTERTAVTERFIPACAGNGSCGTRTESARSVHPRVCGERHGVASHVHAVLGSSPRVRGTGPAQRRHVRRVRFIPACAGNGARIFNSRARPTVHPRVCGERDPPLEAGPLEAGSSPRVRGTGGQALALVSGVRFIPACAGNGARCRSSARTRTVHPRVCGERPEPGLHDRLHVGSSPRVRGTGGVGGGGRGGHRFIPACAGNGLGLPRTM